MADKRNKQTMADAADRHHLYELAVQDTASEYDFVDTTFTALTGRTARVLREDFCGTAQMCCQWARGRSDNIAIGVDLDTEVLGWAKRHNLAKLKTSQRKRVILLHGDVTKVRTAPVDAVLAMNFSYQLFKQRDQLRDYFRKVRSSLVPDGVFFLDAYGGYDSYREITERTKHNGFTYIWDQAHYNPITGEMRCHIHFKFPDGSKLRRAFSYEWRLWTLPEIQETLREAGFRSVQVYWQGTDPDSGEANGEFEPATVGEADPGWICYLTAQR